MDYFEIEIDHKTVCAGVIILEKNSLNVEHIWFAWVKIGGNNILAWPLSI